MKTLQEDLNELLGELQGQHDGYHWMHVKKLRENFTARVADIESKLPSWVNAAERLPENTALVLTWVVDDEDGFARAHVMHHHKTYGWTSWFQMTHARVTHWMPLPEPPK